MVILVNIFFYYLIRKFKYYKTNIQFLAIQILLDIKVFFLFPNQIILG